jgi:hypothetical protein
MAESGLERLHSLLFGKERELKNVKFCPGSNRGLTAEQLSGEAAAMLEAAFAKGDLVDNPPLSGRQKTSI